MLTGLVLSQGELSPALDDAERMYEAAVSLATQRITLQPDVPAGAVVRIDGDELAAGGNWTSGVLSLGETEIAIEVEQPGLDAIVYSLTIARGGEQHAYLKASNTNADDWFGLSVRISGDTMVVGASAEDGDGTPGDGGSSLGSGAAYVFVRNGEGWTQQAYLKARDLDAYDGFGTAVAISGDTIVVGASGEDSASTGVDDATPGESDDSASNSGTAYVFVRSGSSWSQQAYLKASNTQAQDGFGDSVAIDGDSIVIGAYGEDSAVTTITSGGGPSIVDDDAPYAGAAYVFERSGSSWQQQAYLKASNTDGNDYFGYAVDISGDSVIVGAMMEDGAGTGIDNVSPGPSDDNAPDSGAAYLFVRNGETWTRQGYLKASNTDADDRFGGSVAIDGDTAVIGAVFEAGSGVGVNSASPGEGDDSAPESGAAYVFVREGLVWTQQAYVKASNTGPGDHFATSVALDGDTLLIGADYEASLGKGAGPDAEGNNEAYGAGAAYLFCRGEASWEQVVYLKAGNSEEQDTFGFDVAISGDWLVMSAPYEDSAATGVATSGFDADDNDATHSGAAYVFR